MFCDVGLDNDLGWKQKQQTTKQKDKLTNTKLNFPCKAKEAFNSQETNPCVGRKYFQRVHPPDGSYLKHK